MKRNLSRMFRTGVAAAAALLCAMPFQAAAEDYPSRPITLIMPFGAGNAPDTAARIIGDYLQRKGYSSIEAFRGIARDRVVEHSRVRRKSDAYNGGYAQPA